PGLDDSEVDARAPALGEAAAPTGPVDEAREDRARNAHVGRLEQHRSDPPAFAYARLVQIDSAGGEVLAETAGRNHAAELDRPRVEVFGGERVHGLVRATVMFRVGDLVGFEAERSDAYGPVDGTLVDRAVLEGPPGNRTRFSGVDGLDSRIAHFLPGFSLLSPVERAATKASCGTSTRPTIFIRFLPSFCLSSSLRLRLMSPP